MISLPQALRGPRICNLNPFNHFHLSRPLYRRSGLEEVMRKSHQAVEEEPPHHSPAAYQSSSPLQCFKSTCSLTEESGGSRQKMEATKSGGSNTKARFVSAKVGTSCWPSARHLDQRSRLNNTSRLELATASSPGWVDFGWTHVY